MYDEASLHRFGTPLAPLEEDTVPSKKPVYVQDQIATDENGRRRFHGAFTGGFSAGYWNTVGSSEGWTPQVFKSSRSEKAPQRAEQRPEDFMDDEDLGEFGIAPDRIEPKEDYTMAKDGDRKRKFLQPSTGPIPGQPVLEELLRPIRDKVGVRILKSMGWRPGQGVGPRLTRKEKKKARKYNEREMYLMEHYGVKIGAADANASSNEEDDDSDEDEITFAPDDFALYVHMFPEGKHYGLGFQGGLSREPVLSDVTVSTAGVKHADLYEPLEVLDKNNKKLSIRGQGFGVGALEEEDEDIYQREDMTRYDFSLEDKPRTSKKKSQGYVHDKNILPGFVAAKVNNVDVPQYTVELPAGWQPRNWAERRSRFAPLDPHKAKELGKTFHKISISTDAPAALPSTSIDSTSIRGPPKVREDKTKALLERITSRGSNFVRGGLITPEGEEHKLVVQSEELQEQKELLAKATKKTQYLAAAAPIGSFKPFLGNDKKQERYDQFLAANLRNENEISAFLRTIQPVELSEWDREMEKKEFIQARKIYKPLDGSMSERFVSETTGDAATAVEETIKATDPAKKVVMARTKTTWKPSALLCKRYNIAEPYGGALVEETKALGQQKPKLSVFNYLEHSVNTKANFQTPVIVPKHIERPRPEVKHAVHLGGGQVDLLPAEQKCTPVSKPAERSPPAVGAAEQRNAEERPTTSRQALQKPESKGFVATTELEKRVLESLDKPAFEKKELYKAIFVDSDDDDGDGDNNNDAADVNADPKQEGNESEQQQQQNGQRIDTVPPAPFARPAHTSAATNLLRNTSPPRGIFAALFQKADQAQSQPATPAAADSTPQIPSEPKRIAFKSKSERAQSACAHAPAPAVDDAGADDADFYGPKIPAHIPRPAHTSSVRTLSTLEANIEEKLRQIFESQKSGESSAAPEVEYVEKGAAVCVLSSDSDSDSDSSDASSGSAASRKATAKKSHKKSKKKKKKQQQQADRKHKKKKDKKHSRKNDKAPHKAKKSKGK